jgi:iron complex outermembrane receptor protein
MALSLSSAASAQSAGAPESPAVREGGAALEEIVVTAQKREERLQEVPVAVTALTAETLQASRVIEARQLTFITPGLVFTQGGFVARPQIRGVATRGVGPGDEATVPVYIDGVYQASQHANFFDFNNIKQVEVLRGPQGTLLGRNAVGGAINITTYDPLPGAFLKTGGSFGRFNEKIFDTYANIGNERVGGNIAVHVAGDTGYVKDLVTGRSEARRDFQGVRAKFMFRPTDNTSILVGASYIHNNDNTALAQHPIDGVTIAKLVDPNVLIASGYTTSSNAGSYYFSLEQRAFWARAVAEFDGVTVTAIGSTAYTDWRQANDADATVVAYADSNINGDDRSTTAELRATSSGNSRFRWIAGAFYFNSQSRYGFGEDGFFRTRASPTGTTTFLQSDSGVSAYALFGEGTYKLTDRLSITAGVRYSHEQRDFVQFASTQAIGLSKIPLFAPPQNGPAVGTSFARATPRFTVQYAFSDKMRAYATYSQAFKSGVYNASSSILPLVAAEPEVLTAYEAGLKTEPARNLRFNLAGFYYDYTNMQVSVRGANGITTLQNAASSELYGGEAELSWIVTPRLSINATAALTHARYKDFPGAIVFSPAPSRVVQGVIVTSPGLTQTTVNAGGNKLPQTPDATFSLSANYTVPFAGGNLAFASTFYHTSSYFADNGNSYLIPAWANLNGSITLSSSDGNKSIGIWGDNLTNDRHLRTNGLSATSNVGVLASPWRAGVRFTYRFQ